MNEQLNAITIRDSMERPEALDTGTMIMTGLTADEVLLGIEEATSVDYAFPPDIPEPYRVADTSRRVVRFILSTVGRHHEWAGIRGVR